MNASLPPIPCARVSSAVNEPLHCCHTVGTLWSFFSLYYFWNWRTVLSCLDTLKDIRMLHRVSGHFYVRVSMFGCGFGCVSVYVCLCVGLCVWVYVYDCLAVWAYRSLCLWVCLSEYSRRHLFHFLVESTRCIISAIPSFHQCCCNAIASNSMAWVEPDHPQEYAGSSNLPRPFTFN